MNISAIILAAGQGTRMNSKIPKVLHPLAGKPLILHALITAREISNQAPVVVVGHGSDAVRNLLADQARLVIQDVQLGTANAVQAAASLLENESGLVLVTYGDMPLLRVESILELVETQKTHTSGPISMLTTIMADSHGFGRIIRNDDGTVQEIIEEAQATPAQRTIQEVNVGVYCFESSWLWPALARVALSPKGEYYLTDLVGLATTAGKTVRGILLEDSEEAIGINTRVHLAEAELILRRRINTAFMLAGVTMPDPTQVYIDTDVQIGRDTTLLPGTHLHGKTVIGEGCCIGPNTIIEDTNIGSDCRILESVLEGALLENHVSMGPFCHLRKGAHLCNGVHMGNFGEVKNSTLSKEVRMGHFSYIGDAQIGANVNIGAGTITCNFDGVNKYKTIIGEDTFIGSDTMLVAPITIGARAKTGAGSVITHDVPDDTVVVGVPARELKTKNESN